MEQRNLAGKSAVITGASRGLGKAIAFAIAGAGASVALVARNREKLEQCASECRALGTTAEVFTAELTSEAEVAKLAGDVESRLGRITILVNNAGINIRKPVHEFTLDEWNLVVNSNLTSAFLMCRAFVPRMKGNGYGRILNLCSTMSHVSLPGRTAYSATKTALLGFTKALALELAPDHITVNGISPGPFPTELNTPLLENPELYAQFITKVPLGRWGKVEEVGALARFLCSEEAGFITGTDILIDGGWCAQ
jgi:NAD(P)-dependent dehydrogenase (short-subunit alcohol dehydrogenase family)